MELVDSWRLFGPNLQTRGPGVLVEVAFAAGEDPAAGIAAWQAELARMASALGLPCDDAAARSYRGGAVLTFSASIDWLLPATDVNEWAARSAASIVCGRGPLALEPFRTTFAAALVAARNPALLALADEARTRGIPFLWDDDAATLGAGKSSRTWPYATLPDVAVVPWADVAPVPLALVTGTNGKTTSVRLLARLLKEEGRTVGMTTTDGVWIDERLEEGGDYTGPAGAARVLRSPAIDAAVLETARGGVLRRGLAVSSADVALLTNVSDDHLGHYGIDDLEALARVKAVVGSVIPPAGRVVVNAEDPFLVAEARSFVASLVFFAVDPANPVLAEHRARGFEVWTLEAGFLVRASGGETTPLVRATDVPITFGGQAPYNIANALGAAAAARALGVSDGALVRGLTTFTSSLADNPGRGNLVSVRGVQVLVDFAHNPAGIRSVLDFVSRVRPPGGRLRIVAGYAGDRGNESIREAARAIADAHPDAVFLRDLRGYLRGRLPGEVPALFRRELLLLGLPADAIIVADSEAAGVRRALAASASDDFIVVLAHLEADEVKQVLAEGAADVR